MTTILSALFDPAALTPHGFCLLWEPGLIWLQATSDALIGLAYFSIPVVLLRFVRRRPDLDFGWILWLFAGFILACGTTHFMSILTLWEPLYWLEGLVKLATAAVSVVTAVLLWPLLPRALVWPSPALLQRVNEQLTLEIQQRDRNAAALLEREAQLRQSQKMEAVGRLTGGIAHDFNNLLTVVIGSLDRLRRRLASGEEGLVRLVDQALAGSQRAATLTHRLLAFARQQPLAPKPLDVNKLVSGMSDLIDRTLGERYSFETRLAGGLWLIDADANQLENALLNLAVNARDAMPAGGRLTVETAIVELDADYVVSRAPDLQPGSHVLIAVSDNGVGMTPEVAAQAFDPFFTTKPPGQGTGLGLSQVFGFVKQSGGHVAIETTPGEGTSVQMFFPGVPRETDEKPIAAKGIPGTPGRGETVLLVEDDRDVRAFGAELLAELGYRVLVQENGPEAIAILRSQQPVDLLLTDVGLPGMNGRELAERARDLRPGMPILFMSGYNAFEPANEGTGGFKVHPNSNLLVKPFTSAQLAEAVAHSLKALATGTVPP